MRDLIPKIKEVLTTVPGVNTVYLFGSQASGQANAASDVDIAIFFDPQSIPTSEQILDLQETLAARLGVPHADVVVLNRANPILKNQVFKNGTCILKNHSRFFQAFLVRSLTEYADLKRVRAPIEQALLNGRLYG